MWDGGHLAFIMKLFVISTRVVPFNYLPFHRPRALPHAPAEYGFNDVPSNQLLSVTGKSLFLLLPRVPSIATAGAHERHPKSARNRLVPCCAILLWMACVIHFNPRSIPTLV